VTRGADGDAVGEGDAAICRRLGERIRELRDERGLTQQTLAERAGGRTSSKHIGAVERGESAPTATSLVRIAHGLEVTVGELFSTITPGQPPRLPRRTISVARESLRSLNAILDALDQLPPPSESPPTYELQSRALRRRSRTR
jgi:transcriptional regulator with XRE-family HTH domain